MAHIELDKIKDGIRIKGAIYVHASYTRLELNFISRVNDTRNLRVLYTR